MKVTISQRKKDGSLKTVVIEGVITETEGDDVDEMLVLAEESFNRGGMTQLYNSIQDGEVYRIWIETVQLPYLQQNA